LEGDRLNGYYLPKFKTNVLGICKQFPLWSKVMLTYFQSPYSTATSASVEGDFSELKKKKTLKHEGKPMTVDRFVSIHIQSLESSMKFARSHQLYTESNEFDPNIDSFKNSQLISPKTIPYHSPHTSPQTSSNNSPHTSINNSPHRSPQTSSNNSPHRSSNNIPHRSPASTRSNSISSNHSSVLSKDTLKEEETWRGLKNSPMGPLIKDKKRKRQTKYMNPCPEIDRILNRS